MVDERERPGLHRARRQWEQSKVCLGNSTRLVAKRLSGRLHSLLDSRRMLMCKVIDAGEMLHGIVAGDGAGHVNGMGFSTFSEKRNETHK